MSREIRDEDEYERGSKWFARWHRQQGTDDDKAIDLDVVGYCPSCKGVIYLVEATRSTWRKNAEVTELLGQQIGARVLVVYQDKRGSHEDRILVDDRTLGRNHGWVDQSDMWKLLQEIRRLHTCQREITP